MNKAVLLARDVDLLPAVEALLFAERDKQDIARLRIAWESQTRMFGGACLSWRPGTMIRRVAWS